MSRRSKIAYAVVAAGVSLLLPAGRGASSPDATGSATQSPHGKLNVPCQSCHTQSGWKPIRSAPDFDHGQTRYPLRGMHRDVPCVRCHAKPVFKDVGSKCADCHADIHKRQFGASCEQCHNVRGWQVSLHEMREHQNRFPLLGAHAALECIACHKTAATGQFQGLPTQCVACHLEDYRKATPSHADAGFPAACEQCHGMNTWFGARFDHFRSTGFGLTGAHRLLDCRSCHVGGQFKGTPTDCAGCHLGDYRAATNPNHMALGFPQTCQTCHSDIAWRPARFDHATTGFPLTGAHASAPCESCHVNGNYNLADTSCVSCHLKDYMGTTSPNHARAGYSQACQTCHDTSSWSHATFDHSQTGFPLTGAHAVTPCESCHVNGNYDLHDAACASCHQKDYDRTTNPNHAKAGFPRTCEACHNTSSWSNATFDHAKSGFPLTGAHARTPCESCHVDGNYNLHDTACVACHLKDYQGTTRPNHAQAGYSTTCEGCHNTSSWGGGTFDHASTGFPLTGAHATTPCESCHVNGNYNLHDTTCVSCHLKDYQRTTQPNHGQAGFPTTCQTCHDTSSWGSGTFNHAQTGFALTGAHARLPCQACHVNGNYNLHDTTCVSCHLKDYQGTTDPSHSQAGFPTTCETCHTTSSWDGAKFDHDRTAFPLTGAHVGLSCLSCHASGVYKGLPASCVSCHLDSYNGTTQPNHSQAGFPQTCELCHNTSAWVPSSFNHDNTAFPLTGAHVRTPCASCHVNGNYQNVPTDCYSCHKTDYQNTSDPNHQAAGFPTTCQTCHTTNDWSATFDHTWFRIPHHGINLCRDCHTNPSNYTVFSCLTCHAHDKTTMDEKHRGVNGYSYDSAACYQCHKDGGGGGLR
ncbi:MAG: hypothetical protein U0166_09420 [Acidobacteriota bacterium]